MIKDPAGEDSGRKRTKEKVMELVKSIPVSCIAATVSAKKSSTFTLEWFISGLFWRGGRVLKNRP